MSLPSHLHLTGATERAQLRHAGLLLLRLHRTVREVRPTKSDAFRGSNMTEGY